MAKNYDYEVDFGDDDEKEEEGTEPWGSYEDFIRDCEEANPGSTGYTSDFD